MSQQNFVSYDDATSIVTEVASKIAGKQDVLSFDNSPTQNSDNPVKSGGVYTALASKANTSDIGTAAAKNFTTSVTSGSNDLVTSGAVYTAIDNLPEPMVFKGSLGTGGTITALPVNGTATVGDTYKVITAGTYASKEAKVGDTFICLTKTSSANTWELIPSGDEPSGTVTSVTLKATSPIAIDSSSAITSSGTRILSHANSGATAGSYGDSGNQTPGYGSTFKVPYVTVNATGHVTAISEHTVKIPASDNTNTTYAAGTGTTITGSNNAINVTYGSAANTACQGNDSRLSNARQVADNVLTNQDLNSVMAPGFYSAGGGNSVTNKPSGVDHFGLIVVHGASGQHYIQIIYAPNLSKSYRRFCTGGTSSWSSWTEEKITDNNTTYTFANGTNGFKVTPSGGSAQTVTVTPDDTTKLPLAGGTMTGCITTTPNDVNINFRNHSSYYCTASYQTAGNEALVFATKNAVTSFMFVNGEDSVTNHGDSRWKSITPGLQIKNNCVSINKLITDGTSPTYNLEVNGTQYVSGALTTGSTISSTGAISSSGSITAGGLLTAVTGLYTGGRVYNAGDDEGIIIKPTGNGYAGLILGSHNARRSVFYLNSNNVFWRYNNGSTSYDISHPGKAGTIALTSDVTNHTDPIFYGTCSTAAGTKAKVVTASKFSGLAEGVVINVKFSNNNSADSPTLNVNSTGAKAIWKSGGTIKSSNPGWMANEVVSFTYDGTRWIMNDILSSGRLHTQGYNNTCDTTGMTCSVSGNSASLGGLLYVKQATQDLFTIGATGAYVIDTPAQGILINQSTKAIYPIVGIDNLFGSFSGTIPVGHYVVLCNFRVTYAYQDFA